MTIVATDSQLVSYDLPKGLAHKKGSIYGAVIGVGIMMIASALTVVVQLILFVILVVEATNVREVRISPMLVALFGVVVGIFVTWMFKQVGNGFIDQLVHYHEEVQQGKVLRLTTEGGGKTELQWCVVVEGNTRMNQLRSYAAPVIAGDWHNGKYVVDSYVDLRKTSTE